MPSPLPSSFASAAAGNSQESSGGPRRGDMSSGEWYVAHALGYVDVIEYLVCF